jgi:hypothetical protein
MTDEQVPRAPEVVGAVGPGFQTLALGCSQRLREELWCLQTSPAPDHGQSTDEPLLPPAGPPSACCSSLGRGSSNPLAGIARSSVINPPPRDRHIIGQAYHSVE